MFSSWQNTMAHLINQTDPKSKDLKFDSCSMNFSNRWLLSTCDPSRCNYRLRLHLIHQAFNPVIAPLHLVALGRRT
jgi:hypothetical protein